jgi:ammonium transporter
VYADEPKIDPPKIEKHIQEAIDGAKQAGNIAWVLISTGLVFLMIPGLALFYGGMVRRKNLLGTMMHSMVTLAIVGIQWIFLGYSLSFGTSMGGYIGWDWEFVGLRDTLSTKTFPGTDIPIFLHCMFQAMFAIITPALISGAFAERVRFAPYCVFILLWTTLVYDPLAHWVWAMGVDPNDPAKAVAAGWLGKMGALDFAGGTVVHIAAGLSGLAAVLVLKKRTGYPEHAIHPNSMVLTLLGAGLLWFGWFGFNGGSALASNTTAVSALTVTQIAASAAALVWMVVEWVHRGKPTALGFASGVVAGLVAITPASGTCGPLGATCIGAAAGLICYIMVAIKPLLRYDDSLDAFGIHGIGGFLGAVLTGVFAMEASLAVESAGAKDRIGQIVVQLMAAGVACAYSFAVTIVLVKAIDIVMGFNSTPEGETEGLDRTEHGEVAFDFGTQLDSFAVAEPRAATAPPDGSERRFTVVVDGPSAPEIRQAWNALCQAGTAPPTADFKAVYPYVTTMRGNRFRFRGGDPRILREQLQRLLQDRLNGSAVRTYVEN